MLIFYLKLCIVKKSHRKVNNLNNKCDNCRVRPKYIIDDFGAKTQYFCESHLPIIYKDRAKFNMLKVWSEPTPEVIIEDTVAETAPKKNKKKAVAETPVEKVVEEPVIEEPVIEEPITEAVVEDEPDSTDSN